LSNDDINRLIDPQPEYYTTKTWAAVAYAREWALTQGKVRNSEIAANLEKYYATGTKERGQIIDVIRTMNFANKFMNTWTALRKRLFGR
jgi:hypothetical protein